MNPTPILTATALATILLGTAPVAAQRPPKPAAQKPTWPKLSAKDKAAGEKWLKLLRSKKELIRMRAIDQLTLVGPGFADRLLRSMKDSPHGNINEQLAEVLDRLLRPEHAAPLGLHARHKSTFGRRYVLKKLATFGRVESVPVFTAARKDKDIEVKYYAAIGLVKTKKDTAALDTIFERCLEQWGDIGDEVTRFLQGSRSADFVPWIRTRLKEGETHDQVTVMRLMRSLAPASAKSVIKPFLDSEHSILKKETINTLRVIVDGKDPLPLKKITVFRVIKMAKDWKKRI